MTVVTIVMIIMCLAAICVAIALGTSCAHFRRSSSELELKLREAKRKQVELDEQIKKYESTQKGLCDLYNQEFQDNNMLKGQIIKLGEELRMAQVEKVQSDAAGNFDEAIKDSMYQLKLNGSEIGELAVLRKKLDAEIKEIQAQKIEYEQLVRKLKGEINDYDELLEYEKESYRNVLLAKDDNSEVKWMPVWREGKEVRLFKALEEVKEMLPELGKELAEIEWKKIWLPQLQDANGKLGLEVKGIYRLVLKSDRDICYVGQAVNIKERWYQHVKKMLGVMSKGGEKLYDWRPEDFEWTIVEKETDEVEWDSSMLNERERYWIEFFGCVERGLNKK